MARLSLFLPVFGATLEPGTSRPSNPRFCVFMAKKYRIKRSRPSLFSRIVPESAQRFIARRVIDITGLCLMMLGGFTLLAIAGYHKTDPSFNTATSAQDVQNWMGAAGASLSDLYLQTLGLGAALLGIGVFTWGWRLFRRERLGFFALRVVALVAASLLAAMALARIPSGDWLVQAYLGGSAGQMMLQNSADLLHAMGLPYPATLSACLAGIAAIAASSYALAIRIDTWKWLAAMAWFGLCASVVSLWHMAGDFVDWVRHHGDADYRPAQRKKPARPRLIAREDEDEDIILERTAIEDAEEENSFYDADYEEGADPSSSSIKVIAPQKAMAGAKSRQTRFALFEGGDWDLPDLDLLQEVPDITKNAQLDENALRMNAELLQNVLSDFNIQGEITSIHPGPVVTLYELEPAPGTKSARVISLADDIARSMSATSVRCAVVPGRNVIGIELPNKKRQTVYMRELLETQDYEKTQSKLPLVLGKDIGGKPIIADLARMPHLLVAGTTGSGKSVAINTMIMSLLYRLPPEKCRFIMVDPKMLELSVYDDIPHLLAPVVTEPGKAVVALKWVVGEMEERYRAMSKLGVRNIDGYNARLAEARKKGEVLMRKVQTGFDPETGKPVHEEQPLDLTDLPYIVVIVDEFADLMLVAGKDVENAIQRLAQMARAAGIHLIMATQRPSVDVITGVVKANFPARISFAVTSKIDSRTILGDGGAEQLLGQGDMLYMAAGGRITRVHGPFASDEDVENVATYLKKQAEPAYLEEITEGGFEASEVMNAIFSDRDGDSAVDDLYDEAVAIVAREQKASTSFIQRHLQIGYNRAARIIEEMERQGVISKANAVGKRNVLVGDYSDA